MIKLQAWIILVCYVFYFCDCGTLPATQQAEQTLITTLLNGYNKMIRPDVQVSVDITATLQQIVAIDEKQQIMTSTSFISQTWYDYRLSWTPSSNGNITVVMIPVTSLWIPDTMILNSADTSGYLTVNTYSLASVNCSGQVYMILPALTVKTRCNFFLRNFPFDKQMCSINITSWAQGSTRVQYTEEKDSVIDISEYTEHPLWKLNGTDMIVYKAEDRTPFEDTTNNVISIQLYLQRKPLFFIMNGIFACLILNCVTLLSFILPFGSQVSLCMVCFMTYSVYSLNFSNLFPQQSDYLMMITLYFLLSICWTLISMLWFTMCNHYTTKAEMPKRLYAFCGLLQRVFFFSFPPPKEDDKTVKKKDGIIEKSENKETTTATSTQKMKCVSCQKLFASCFQRHNRVENIDKQEHIIVVEGMESIKTNPTDVQPIEPAAREVENIDNQQHSIVVGDMESIKTNPTDVQTVETAVTENIKETNDKAEIKCNFCSRCETCQADFDKDKAKGKKKKDIEARCSALNHLIFLCVLLGMFISDMAVWISMSE